MSLFGNIRLIRDGLSLANRLSSITDPITTEAGLMARFEILLDAADLLGLPVELRAKLQAALDEPHELQLALAVVQFAYIEWVPTRYEFDVLSLEGAQHSVGVPGAQSVLNPDAAASFASWLPVALQLLTLIQELIAARRSA